MPRIPATPPSASMNRVRIVDLPGIDIDDHIRGKLAYNLLSATHLADLALEQAEVLGIPDALRALPHDSEQVRSQVPRLVSERYTNGSSSQRQAASALAYQLGRNLAAIFLTIHRGDAINRAARMDWTAADWAYWAGVRKLYVGGGLMSSDFGAAMVAHANDCLQSTGYTDLIVKRSPWAQHMGTLGASRYLPQESRCALVLDLGQTSVKSAVVHINTRGIQKLDFLPGMPVAWPWHNAPTAGETIPPEDVVTYTASTIATAYRNAQEKHHLDQDIMLCIAAYVHDGKLLGNGIYARMSLLGEDVRVILAAALARQGLPGLHLHLIHDGTAAAAVHAGEPDCAVWVIGTAIGVGFPEANDGHLHKMPVLMTQPEGRTSSQSV